MKFLYALLLTLLLWVQVNPASASLEVTRMEIYFDNRRAETTVDRNFHRLRAYAVINLKGSGLLQGVWKVDNQIIGQVSQPVTGEQVLTLQTPDIPPLPTFNPGSHRVQLQITNPSTALVPPTALYFVSSTEQKKPGIIISPQSPPDNSVQKKQALVFSWEPLSTAAFYKTEFYDRAKGGSAIFSALTRQPSYKLDESRLGKLGLPGKWVFWKVRGFDKKRNMIAESSLWRFSFEK
jgi:hypothetical protein